MMFKIDSYFNFISVGTRVVLTVILDFGIIFELKFLPQLNSSVYRYLVSSKIYNLIKVFLT